MNAAKLNLHSDVTFICFSEACPQIELLSCGRTVLPRLLLLSEASMLPCLALMESAEPHLLFPVITGNSVPDNPLPPAPPQFLRFSLHYACSEIPVFHSSYIHSSHCNKVSSNNKNHALCYQRKGIFILCVCFICAI